jgi:hypothetical protein
MTSIPNISSKLLRTEKHKELKYYEKWLQKFWYIFKDILKDYATRILRIGRNTSSFTALKMEAWNISK